MKRYTASSVKNSMISVLKLNNVSSEQACIVAETMIEADMRGVNSHGVSVFPAYVNKIKNNGFDLTSEIKILKKTSAFALVSANNQLGMVSAKKCMELALEQAKTSGIYTVFCRNANTFGAGFKYVKMATDKKMIGICFSNSPSQMPAWEGEKKVLGTNPFAVGIPTLCNVPIIIDMATSVVAKSKINEARKRGEEIPLGWAVDEGGCPTTDPVKAIKGMILPMAGYKGYAISMAIDLIAGVLSGAGYLNGVNRFYSETNECMNVGQCFVAIDPTIVYGEDFFAEIDEYIAQLKSSGDKVCYPGENSGKLMVQNEKGVELSEETVAILDDLFMKHGVANALVEYDG